MEQVEFVLAGVGTLACFARRSYRAHAFSVGKTLRCAPFCTNADCMLYLATILVSHAPGAQLGQNRDEEESAGGPR